MTCDSPFYVLPKAGTEKVPVPCGRCPVCKRKRASSWAFRLKQHERKCPASFVTLTYDTDHVPISVNGFPTLCKRDVQLFYKRLRKLCPGIRIKYYTVGEYGTQGLRPHYHAILYGAIDQSIIDQAWGLGSTHVGTVTGASIEYTLKYISKPPNPRVGKFSRDDRVREFSLMSKGLGVDFLSDAATKFHHSRIDQLYVTVEGGVKLSMPRYYRNKIWNESERRRQSTIIQAVVALEQSKDTRTPAEIDAQRYERHRRFYHRTKFHSNEVL
ncbi:MAG: replication initiator protein [Microvirus sp.]|nr:MAG: replication initiator protein [Microvirus sp.]